MPRSLATGGELIPPRPADRRRARNGGLAGALLVGRPKIPHVDLGLVRHTTGDRIFLPLLPTLPWFSGRVTTQITGKTKNKLIIIR